MIAWTSHPRSRRQRSYATHNGYALAAYELRGAINWSVNDGQQTLAKGTAPTLEAAQRMAWAAAESMPGLKP